MMKQEQIAVHELSKVTTWLLVSFSAAVIVSLLAIIIFSPAHEREFVRGKYGSYCYTVETANRHITTPLYFNTYQDCMASLGKI